MQSVYDWLSPTEAGLMEEAQVDGGVDRLREVLRIHREGDRPDLEGAQAAIIGVVDRRGSVDGAQTDRAPEAIRRELYRLTPPDNWKHTVDLGNLVAGERPEDTRAALREICADLMAADIVPIVLGGSQSLSSAMYNAFESQNRPINIVTADARLDFGGDPTEIDSGNWLNDLILAPGGRLFDYTNLGHQRYLNDGDLIQLMQRMHFDPVRLGELTADLRVAEPIIRHADLVSFDLGVVRAADHPAQHDASPNGLYGEQFCQLARYAGFSDRVTSFGIFELDPNKDGDGRSARLAAQSIWCFLEGLMERIGDYPRGSASEYIKYRVDLKQAGHEVVFYKSPRSDRWWMDVPAPNPSNKKGRLHLVPCTYADYEKAAEGELPDRWWRTYQKLG